MVIISLVRSNEEVSPVPGGYAREGTIDGFPTLCPQGEVGFLREMRRLNVSMTRPRRHLVVVGDSDTVSKGSEYLKSWMTWLEDEALVKVPS